MSTDLGKIHVSTLKKLYDAAGEPVTELHPAVNGLIDAGYAYRASDGVRITDVGVWYYLLLRHRFQSRHRSFLMRTWGAFLDDKPYYIEKTDEPVATQLRVAGLIDVQNEFAELTDDGLQAWVWYLKHRGEWKATVERKVEALRPELVLWTAAEVDATDTGEADELTTAQWEALEVAVEHPDAWVPDDALHGMTRKVLTGRGLILHNPSTGKYRLTDEGLSLVGTANNGASTESDAETTIADADESVVDVQTESHRDGANDNGASTDCEECIDRKVLALLAEKYPQVKALKDAIEEEMKVRDKQQALLDELGLSS